jgi:hypothetical protein
LRFGGLVTAISVTILAVLVGGGIAIGALFRVLPLTAAGAVDWPAVLNAWLGFGQVYTGFVAVFLAGTLGHFAITEFAQAQERPQLRLVFHPTLEQTLNLGPQRFIDPQTLISVAALNEGPVVGVWFQINLHVPFVRYDMSQPVGARRPIQPVVGTTEENWRAAAADDGGLDLAFLSNGSIAAYPNFPLILCQFLLPRGMLTEDRYVLAYTIGTDRSQPVTGELVIT